VISCQFSDEALRAKEKLSDLSSPGLFGAEGVRFIPINQITDNGSLMTDN
jgi:hypothetical protein